MTIFNKKSKQEEIGSNFWISFTDIMTCLVLVILFLLIYFSVLYTNSMNRKEELERQLADMVNHDQSLAAYIAELREKAKAYDEFKDKIKDYDRIKAAYEEMKRRLPTYASLKDDLEKIEQLGGYEAVKRKLDAYVVLQEKVDNFDNVDDQVIKIMAAIVEDVQAAGYSVELDPTNKTIHIPDETVSFKLGSSIPKGQTEMFCIDLRRILHRHLNLYARSLIDSIFIEGHTDNNPVINDRVRGNWKLSSDRAISFWIELSNQKSKAGAYDYEYDDGINLESLTNSRNRKLFSVSGYAETRPLCSYEFSQPGCPLMKTDKDSKNRRIDLRFVPYHKNFKNR